MGHALKQVGLVIFFFVFLSVGPLRVSATQEIEGNIDDVARAILTYFPKVAGRVTEINQGRVEVELESGQGLAEGVLLTVFQEKEAFYHPVTGIRLGRFENEVGIIEVLMFKPPRLTANRIDSKKEIKVGSLVRLPATKIPVAISMHSKTEHSFLMNELASALNDTGRFRVDLLPSDADSKVAFRRENHYYISLVTARHGEGFSLNLKIQNTTTGKLIAGLNVLIHQSEESDLILEHLQYELFKQRQGK